uniref:Uncharacterized protein n=1 Tax=Arundo donax TaxID=35708 RepID=A0A0A9C6P3_ARUDO
MHCTFLEANQMQVFQQQHTINYDVGRMSN